MYSSFNHYDRTRSSKAVEVQDPSNAYVNMEPNWILIEDLISGTYGIRKRHRKYLPQMPREQDESYDNRLYGYPDSSGGARSTNASKTDIQILESYGISNQSGASNPSIKDSVNNVQRLLCNGKEEISLFVHPRCKNVIESLELQSYTEAGEPEKTGLDHFSDCVRYLCWRCFNPLHLGAGRKTGIRIY